MRRALFIAAVIAGCGPGGPPGNATSEDAALEAYQRGDFDKAEALLAGARDPETILLRADILLLRNRNREAVELLTANMPKKVNDVHGAFLAKRAVEKLAFACVRMDDFARASNVYRSMGNPVLAKKFEILTRNVGYLPEFAGEEARVDLLTVDPVPVVPVAVNGRDGLFIIDTGVDEVRLDAEFAQKARVNAIALRSQALQEQFGEAFAESVQLGALRVKNVPVRPGKLPDLSAVKADGVLGLSFLMHFDFTIDFRRSRLILRKTGGAVAGVPAFLAGDRNLLVAGSVNGAPGAFVGVGTGLANVQVAASPLWLDSHPGEIREIAAGPLRLARPRLDTNAFPQGLDGAFGFPVGFVLGPKALAGRSLRLEPRSMRLLIE